jgi:hypothetical protein
MNTKIRSQLDIKYTIYYPLVAIARQYAILNPNE